MVLNSRKAADRSMDTWYYILWYNFADYSSINSQMESKYFIWQRRLVRLYETFEMKITRGLILSESLPRLFIASRMQARSTTAGTPVKSWEENKVHVKNYSLRLNF